MQHLDAVQFQTAIREPGTLLLDVRTPAEARIAALPGALLIPVDELPARAAEVGTPSAIAIYCHHGVRSELAGRILERLGHERVAHLVGGIDAWSCRIDPAVPRY